MSPWELCSAGYYALVSASASAVGGGVNSGKFSSCHAFRVQGVNACGCHTFVNPHPMCVGLLVHLHHVGGLFCLHIPSSLCVMPHRMSWDMLSKAVIPCSLPMARYSFFSLNNSTASAIIW